MDNIAHYAKEAFEPKLGRPLTDTEAAELAMHLRRFAAFLIDCAKDTALMQRLGMKREGEGSAGARVVNNTSENAGKPLRSPFPARADVPTGVPSRNTLPHCDSSASLPDSSAGSWHSNPYLVLRPLEPLSMAPYDLSEFQWPRK